MARRGFTPTHDRGRVLVDVAVLIAGGGEAIADIDVLRHQSEVLGSVASAPTVWRALDEVTHAATKRIDTAGQHKRRSQPRNNTDGGIASDAIRHGYWLSARGVTLLMASLRVGSVGRWGSHGEFSNGCQLLSPKRLATWSVHAADGGKCTVDVTLIRLARSEASVVAGGV